LVIKFAIKMFHIGFMQQLRLKSCVTWQGTHYKLPEDDTIVSKHVGA